MFCLTGGAAYADFVCVINNTIRLAVYSKRFLIHTMKLVVASWSFIRRPFLLRNMWIGILAATMADAVLIGLAYMLVHYEPDLLAVVTPGVMVVVMGAVFVFGVLITSLCALISINKYLRMKVSELYWWRIIGETNQSIFLFNMDKKNFAFDKNELHPAGCGYGGDYHRFPADDRDRALRK